LLFFFFFKHNGFPRLNVTDEKKKKTIKLSIFESVLLFISVFTVRTVFDKFGILNRVSCVFVNADAREAVS